MLYADLPPSPTFWRCPECANEAHFRANGIGHITCTECGRDWTSEQLKQAHASAHADQPTPSR